MTKRRSSSGGRWEARGWDTLHFEGLGWQKDTGQGVGTGGSMCPAAMSGAMTALRMDERCAGGKTCQHRWQPPLPTATTSVRSLPWQGWGGGGGRGAGEGYESKILQKVPSHCKHINPLVSHGDSNWGYCWPKPGSRQLPELFSYRSRERRTDWRSELSQTHR